MINRKDLPSMLDGFQSIDFKKYTREQAELWITRECITMSLTPFEVQTVVDIILGVDKCRFKVIVMGYKRHGKDTACEYLRDKYGVTFASSSYTACELFLFNTLKDKLGYHSIDEAFDDRGNHRKIWYNEIKAFNQKNGLTTLGEQIFKANDIYCGIRDRDEFLSLKAANIFTLTIWIDASERLPSENKESMNLNINDADIVICNNGTHKNLYDKLDKLYELTLKP